jgi:hypothetical protein
MFLFSLTTTCLVRNVKERIKYAKTYKSSLLSLLATGIGLAALQVCGAGGLFCGANIFIGILSSILPNIMLGFLDKYSLLILIISIFTQIFSLYKMKCFHEAKISFLY